MQHAGARIAEHQRARSGRHAQIETPAQQHIVVHVEKIEPAAIVHVDPRLQRERAIVATHFADQPARHAPHIIAQHREQAMIEHGIVLAVPACAVGAPGRFRAGRAHRLDRVAPLGQVAIVLRQPRLPDHRGKQLVPAEPDRRGRAVRLEGNPEILRHVRVPNARAGQCKGSPSIVMRCISRRWP